MGLFLGASIMTICEILDLFFFKCFHLVKKSKEKKTGPLDSTQGSTPKSEQIGVESGFYSRDDSFPTAFSPTVF